MIPLDKNLRSQLERAVKAARDTNIRPFMAVPDVGKKGAGVLRDKPNIHWNKDRGKDVESAPWYPLFKGERINDHHLTLAEKRAARQGGSG